ncbi:DUF2062 domain-containing protein [Rhodalgimonas zhirmunskyi]|uniref:DUF2062 domain-containing protein n=1 Tax=Rhodalgimonas zhirmunskyi TaxID=2964767 RepID=A0AAJ1X629_9RHOB|nr:DUF2062 domain-containing protein [Rhodoalgimonas zhirmunskyi]MDQ2095843.1 DUF2062 domain-containing protein [Rhodoalgimonas zhirmunskyi]
MVFKRRDRRPFWKIVIEFFYPRGGWLRAALYVKHRLNRLPDPPHKISRGIWAGVFTTFTPFYGLHFVVAALIARIMQGNILAALLATFFGNPLTYLPIGIVSLKTGHWILGSRFDHHEAEQSLGRTFARASEDLWFNLRAWYDGAPTDWTHLHRFYDDVFFPYMVGGIIPGVIVASIAYYIALPLLQAYQKHRKSKLKAKLEAIRAQRLDKATTVQLDERPMPKEGSAGK